MKKFFGKNGVADFNEMVLREIGNQFGFEAVQISFGEFYMVKAEYVNFTVHSSWENSSWEDMIERRSISLSASISRMGGNMTVDDLRAAADEISRAAAFVEKVNEMKIVIERHYKKEEE